MSGDPLAGLSRPLGAPEALAGIGSRWTGGAEALGHTSQVLVGMTGRLLAQSWSGTAAMACASACARDAGLVAMSADAFQIGGAAMTRYATQLRSAQAQYDRAAQLASQSITDEHQHAAAIAAKPPAPFAPLSPFLLAAPWQSPLRASARAMAQDAISQAKTAAAQAAGVLEQTLAPFVPKPPPMHKPEHHWYTPATDFLGGAWDSVKDPAVMIGGLVGLHGDTGQNWSDLGNGLAHGFTHPVDLGKAVIDWQDLSQGHYARWAGGIVPSAAAAFFTGGAAAGVKGADALNATARTGKALDKLSEADKAALLARGETLVPGAVGAEAATSYLTGAGRLDYSKIFDRELQNFTSVTSKGSVTLDRDLWLANVHNGKAALNAGRSLKFSAPLDEVLGQSRGGYLQRLALVPQWGPRTDVSILHIPQGTDIHLAEGTTRSQVSHLTVAGHEFAKVPIGTKSGSGIQVLLRDVDKDWVVWTGKAPWPSHGAIAASSAKGAGLVAVPDALADLSQQP